MKLKSLKIKNFAKFTDFECKFNDSITHLVGVNGGGKTTIGLTAIWACLKGIAEKNKDGQLIGERFRFIGSEKATADIEIKVFDENSNEEVTIRNHISKQSNEITCSPVKDNNWLNSLLSVAFISAKNFSLTDSKEQAKLLGIDTSKFDKEIKELKDEYTIINREYRTFGELKEVEKVDPVDYTKLINEKDKIESEYYNKQRIIDEHNRKAIERNNNIVNVDEKIKEYEKEIIQLQTKIKDCETWKKDHPKIEPKETVPEPDLTEIKTKIENSKEINQKASEYLTYIEKNKSKNKKKAELEINKEQQSQAEADKLAYIKSFNFGFDGLSVDDEGGLILDGRPIKEPYFSKGELEQVVAKLYASRNPEFKVRFIDDFELLDEDNQAKIIDELLSEGFQIITAEVGKEPLKDNTLLLKECKLVDSYEAKQQKLL